MQYTFPAIPAHGASRLGTSRQIFKSLGQSSDVAGRNDTAVPSFFHKISGAPSNICTNDRQAACHGLVHHQAPYFGVGREDKGFGKRVVNRQILPMNKTRESNAARSHIVGKFTKLGPRSTVAYKY
jgi:hypothetical protein